MHHQSDGNRHSSLSLIREEVLEADDDPPLGLISLAAGDKPISGQSRKLTSGSGDPSRQSEITFSATAVGNRLAKRFVDNNYDNRDSRASRESTAKVSREPYVDRMSQSPKRRLN